jgi:tetratricopeptide (TPR) repeat protein
MGDFQQGLEQLQEAKRLEPLSPMISVQLGVGLYLSRQFEEAERVLLHTIEFEPAFWPAHYFLGTVYARQRDSRALPEMEVAADLSGRHPLALSGLGRVLGQTGRTEQAGKVLEELSSRSRIEYISPHHFAVIHLELGDQAMALERLKESVSAHSPYAVWLKVEPTFDILRSDFRFTTLIDNLFGHGSRTPKSQNQK